MTRCSILDMLKRYVGGILAFPEKRREPFGLYRGNNSPFCWLSESLFTFLLPSFTQLDDKTDYPYKALVG